MNFITTYLSKHRVNVLPPDQDTDKVRTLWMPDHSLPVDDDLGGVEGRGLAHRRTLAKVDPTGFLLHAGGDGRRRKADNHDYHRTEDGTIPSHHGGLIQKVFY